MFFRKDSPQQTQGARVNANNAPLLISLLDNYVIGMHETPRRDIYHAARKDILAEQDLPRATLEGCQVQLVTRQLHRVVGQSLQAPDRNKERAIADPGAQTGDRWVDASGEAHDGVI